MGSIKRSGRLSGVVMRWRMVYRLDIGDRERFERLRTFFRGSDCVVLRLALKLYSGFVLDELPTPYTLLPDGGHEPFILTHRTPEEIDETTASRHAILVRWNVWRRMRRVMRVMDTGDFTPVVRAALALLERVTDDGTPQLYVRCEGGEYEPYSFY